MRSRSARGKWAVAGLLAQWWAKTSVVLQRANAEALLASLGDQSAGEGLDEDGEQDDPGLGEQPVVAALLPTDGRDAPAPRGEPLGGEAWTRRRVWVKEKERREAVEAAG